MTPEGLLTAANDMLPVLRARQAACEALGRLPEETIQAFVDAGFYRILQPRRFGGCELDLLTFFKVMISIARGCPSSGWVLALTAGHAHTLASLFPEQGQIEIFGPDGEYRAPMSLNGVATAAPVDGGYLVSGAWDYASGCDHATHFMGSAIVRGSDPPRLLWLLIDRADFLIVDNWDVIALRGTGSKRVTCEDLFVPEHRTITAVGMTDEASPGWGTHENPLYAGALFTLLFFELGAIAVGVARGAVDVYEEVLRNKPIDIPPFTLRGEIAEYQHHLGEAIGLVDVAEAALLEGADRYLEQAERALDAGRPVDELGEETRRLMVLQQQCIRLTSEAVHVLFRTGGTSGARVGNPLGNAMLALTVMRTHMGLQLDRTMTNVGRLRIGLDGGLF